MSEEPKTKPDYSHAKRIIDAVEKGVEVQRRLDGAWGLPISPAGRYALDDLNSPDEFRIKPETIKVEIWRNGTGVFTVHITGRQVIKLSEGWAHVKTIEVEV